MLQEGSVSAVFQHRQGAKKADFNQAMTRVDPIMEDGGGSAVPDPTPIACHCPQTTIKKIKIKAAKNKQTNGGPCKISVCLAGSNTISLCCSLSQHRNPRETEVGRREADVPSHISCVRMRTDVAPVFCSLPGREPTIPTWRHLSSRCTYCRTYSGGCRGLKSPCDFPLIHAQVCIDTCAPRKKKKKRRKNTLNMSTAVSINHSFMGTSPSNAYIYETCHLHYSSAET